MSFCYASLSEFAAVRASQNQPAVKSLAAHTGRELLSVQRAVRILCATRRYRRECFDNIVDNHNSLAQGAEKDRAIPIRSDPQFRESKQQLRANPALGDKLIISGFPRDLV